MIIEFCCSFKDLPSSFTKVWSTRARELYNSKYAP